MLCKEVTEQVGCDWRGSEVWAAGWLLGSLGEWGGGDHLGDRETGSQGSTVTDRKRMINK